MIKIKAGTIFILPVEFEDDLFDKIEAIEFLFKQTENGPTLKTAYWTRDGYNRDAQLIQGQQIIIVRFTREDSYLFRQNDFFFLDTRIHYKDSDTNPYTNIVRLRMSPTLFARGEEVTS